MSNKPAFVFWGTPDFAVIILNELKEVGFLPALVVTAPDKPKGRHLVLTPPPVKVWALENNVDVLQSEKIDADFIKKLQASNWDLFIVAAYGKILKKEVLDLPAHGTLNVHPSLLPAFRGSSPIESAILAGLPETGVSIMLLDEQMDHGPVLAQKKYQLGSDTGATELEAALAHIGGALLAETIPSWVAGEIKAISQDNAQATFTKKIKKEDGLLDLATDPAINYRKFKAYEGWPRTYYFKDEKRVIVTQAQLVDGELKIEKVLPEGKKEMGYEDFLRSK